MKMRRNEIIEEKRCCNKFANINRKKKQIHENVDDEMIKNVYYLEQNFEFRFKQCLIIENVYEQNYYTT